MDTFGLWWFTQDNRSYLTEEISLKSTKLIIDAEEFPYKVFRRLTWIQNQPSEQEESSSYEDSDKLGGDLICFKRKLIELFGQLAKCNIEPVIVFGGPRTQSTRFSKESIEKDFARKKREGNTRSLEINPLHLVEIIFTDVIEGLKLQTKQLNERKHSAMFQLANQLDCPILTSNTDFLLYPLKRGFIMLEVDPVDLFPYHRIVNKCIKCHLFSQRKLIQSLPGLQVSTVPLLKVLIEIFFRKDNSIRRALDSIGNMESEFNQNYYMNKRIASFLKWMQGKSYPELVEEFCNIDRYRGQNENHEELKTKMMNHMDKFYDSGRDYRSLLADYYGQHANEGVVNYLYNLFDELKLDCIGYNLILKRVHYAHVYFDHSPYDPKRRPYSVALCLLRPLPYDQLSSLDEIREKLNKDTFTFFESCSLSYLCEEQRVEPSSQLEGFGTLDHLSVNSLMTLSEDEKKKLLLATFRSNCDHLEAMERKILKVIVGKPKELNEILVLLILLKYTNEESALFEKFPQLKALEHSFKLAVLLTCLVHITSDLQIHLIGCKLEPILANTNVRADDELYKLLVHQIYSLQSSIGVFCMLNSLLGQIFPKPQAGDWFSGPFILKLTKAIKSGNTGDCLKVPIIEAINSLI